MSTTFYAAPDNVSTTTTGYTAAAGSIALAAGTGAAFGTTFPLLVSTFLADGTPKGVYSVSGRSADTLTGLALVSGTDATLPAGSIVAVRWTAEHVARYSAAVNALEVTAAGLGTAATHAATDFDATGAASAVSTTLAAHTANTSNPHAVTKAQVGLGNVDNTSDAAKPVSTAAQAALDLKAPRADPTFTGAVTVGTLTGLVKAATGVLSAAAAGTDYLAPGGSGAALTGITESQVAGLTADLSTLTAAVAARLAAASNLSDLASAATARTNLGLGTAATHPATDFAASSVNGTVTSVGLTMPGVIFIASVTGSPVTTSGTLAPALATQTANTVLAGPTTGSAATPTFRALVAADVPNHSAALLTSGTVATAQLGSGSASATTFLRGDQSYAVPAATVASGTSGRVPYEGAGGVLTDAAGLAYSGTALALAAAAGTTPVLGVRVTGDGSDRAQLAPGGVWAGSGSVAPTQILSFAFAATAGAYFPGGAMINGSLANAANGNGGLQASLSPLGFSFVSTASGNSPLGVRSANGGHTAPAFVLQDWSSTNVPRNCGSVDASFNVATDATWTGDLTLYAGDFTAANLGRREGVRVRSDGTQPLLGFYGVTPVARAAACVTLADVIAALKNSGLTS